MYLRSSQEKWNNHANGATFALQPKRISNDNAPTSFIRCDWLELRAQLLSQWSRITEKEIDQTGANRYRIARLIEHKYGIAFALVENYLLNFERTMPFAAKQIRSQ